MTIHIQVHAATMRLWVPGKKPFVDPFDWSGGIVPNPESRGVVVILGAMGAPPAGHHREIFEHLAGIGYDTAKWERHRRDRPAEWAQFDLAPYLKSPDDIPVTL